MENKKAVFETIAVIILMLVIGCSFMFYGEQSKETLDPDEFLRIHIRANSNSNEDQEIKYKVKDEVVKALIPILSDADSKDKALNLIQNNLELIESTADNVLLGAGFNYKSQAELKKEYFPTRTYDGLTLQSDVYDAIILNLGTGTGDNWWCVAYPPLCFVGGQNDDTSFVVYRSKFLEIIKKFFN